MQAAMRLLKASCFLSIVSVGLGQWGAVGPSRAAAQKTVSPTAEVLYDRSLSADDHFSYLGRQITTYWNSGHTVAVTVEHQVPDLRRIDYLAPERLEGMIFLSDGRQEWRYYPAQHLVRHRAFAPNSDAVADAAAAYTLLKSNYSVLVTPKKQYWDNRKTFILTIWHLRRHIPARRLWIDAATGLVLKREIYENDGRLAVTVAFSDINFHPHFSPAAFSPDIFIKPGIRVVQDKDDTESPVSLASLHQSLGKLWLLPSHLNGFELVGAGITQGKKPLLQLRYSDGLNLISLFELRRTQTRQPTRVPASMHPLRIGSVLGHVVTHASLTAINWDTPVFNLTLIGELPQEKLVQMALIAAGQKP
jgi:outer membrane lipoprotein-sorting protein